jgi:CHAD domain-containing protein
VALDAAGGEATRAGHESHPADYAEVVEQAVLKQWRLLARSEPGARRGDDLEALHDMRVASRRLRAALRVFGPWFPKRKLARVRKRVRKLTRSLGTAREWDVHGETLAGLHAGAGSELERAAIEHILELVDARRLSERSAMARALDRMDLEQLGRDLAALLQQLDPDEVPHDPAPAAQAVLEPLVEAAFGTVARLQEKERADELHAMRIGVKRLRYALELLEPAFDDSHARLIARTKSLQGVLGKHHDLVLLEELLTRALKRLSEHGRRALADGLVGPLERVRVERRARYAEFLTATQGLSAASFADEVRRGLHV